MDCPICNSKLKPIGDRGEHPAGMTIQFPPRTFIFLECENDECGFTCLRRAAKELLN